MLIYLTELTPHPRVEGGGKGGLWRGLGLGGPGGVGLRGGVASIGGHVAGMGGRGAPQITAPGRLGPRGLGAGGVWGGGAGVVGGLLTSLSLARTAGAGVRGEGVKV